MMVCRMLHISGLLFTADRILLCTAVSACARCVQCHCSYTACAAAQCSLLYSSSVSAHSRAIISCCYCHGHYRAATLATSDTLVQRDLFYTGNIINEKASIVLRLAPTFLRFGSFEIFRDTDARTGRKGPSTGNTALLKQVCVQSLFILHTITVVSCQL